MAGGATSVGRSARAEDVSAVAACLASAFFEDPVWGDWSFPDRSSRSQPLFELMASWARAAARYPWVRMTGDAEAVAVWIPPGQPEMTDDEVALFDALVSRLFGSRADELNALFELFEEHHPDEPRYYLSLWGTDRNHAGYLHLNVLGNAGDSQTISARLTYMPSSSMNITVRFASTCCTVPFSTDTQSVGE